MTPTNQCRLWESTTKKLIKKIVKIKFNRKKIVKIYKINNENNNNKH